MTHKRCPLPNDTYLDIFETRRLDIFLHFAAFGLVEPLNPGADRVRSFTGENPLNKCSLRLDNNFFSCCQISNMFSLLHPPNTQPVQICPGTPKHGNTSTAKKPPRRFFILHGQFPSHSFPKTPDRFSEV